VNEALKYVTDGIEEKLEELTGVKDFEPVGGAEDVVVYGINMEDGTGLSLVVNVTP